MNAGSAPRRGGPGGDNNLDALNDADVADLWVVDPETGSYRLRTPDANSGAPSAGSPVTSATPGAPAPRGGGSDRLPAVRGGASAGRSRTANNRTIAPPRTSPEADPARPQPSRTGRRAPKAPSKAKKRIKWTAITLAGVLVVVAGGAYGYYLYLNSRIKKTDRSAANEVPPSAADEFGRTPLNILLIGSDTRVGKGNQVGGETGHEGLADSTILMHLSADRSNATMVSIPRDTMVDRPACNYEEDGDKKVHPASTQKVQFNSTLGTPPGAPCTVATVERMLGVQVDHYLLIDFNGVKQMTKAVGGVPINLCGPINDPVLPNKQGGTGLKLKAGPQRLEGNDALQFLRARHAFGDGSDLARIEAQKSFLMALAREVKRNAKWSNPKAVFDIAQAATGNLQVDRGLGTIDKLAALGNEIKKIPEDRMAFTTLPNEPYPGNPDAWVQQRQPDAANLWKALATDTAVTQGNPAAPVSSPPPAAATTPAAPAPAPVDPSTMRVTVRNTTDAPKAKSVVEQLDTLGYKAEVDSTESSIRDNSVIRYPAGKADAARQLAVAVGISEVAIEESASGTSTFQLIIGSDFPNLDSADAPIAGAAPAGSAPQSGTAGAPATTAPPVVAVPPAADLKLNTADNEACIPTNSKK